MNDRTITLPGDEIAKRWPHIERFIRVDKASGRIEANYSDWHFAAGKMEPCQKVAAAYEEWADYFEWQLAQRAAELATDRVKRHLVAEWTDSMVYSCRRSAVWARGEEPGPWIPQRERRPDLDAEQRAILDVIAAGLDARNRSIGRQRELAVR